MKILIAPLNWGLGHASRCIPLIRHYLTKGHEVVLAGDGESLSLLRRNFPDLRVMALPHLNLRYSNGNSQIRAMLRAFPKIIAWAIADHKALKKILRTEPFDRVISDNRFGCYAKGVQSVYITHQLLIPLPHPWQWLQPMLHRVHLRIIQRYSECWIPDHATEPSLSGKLSHYYPLPSNARFVGVLSRFPVHSREVQPTGFYDVVAVLSGLEPQRTLFEQAIIGEYSRTGKSLLIVRGKPDAPFCKITKNNITLVPYMDDALLQHFLLQAETVIARSGYSTVMDLYALGVLSRSRLVPTPGQPEQEYLAAYIGSLGKH